MHDVAEMYMILLHCFIMLADDEMLWNKNIVLPKLQPCGDFGMFAKSRYRKSALLVK